jgi:hypothetical protein
MVPIDSEILAAGNPGAVLPSGITPDGPTSRISRVGSAGRIFRTSAMPSVAFANWRRRACTPPQYSRVSVGDHRLQCGTGALFGRGDRGAFNKRGQPLKGQLLQASVTFDSLSRKASLAPGTLPVGPPA